MAQVQAQQWANQNVPRYFQTNFATGKMEPFTEIQYQQHIKDSEAASRAAYAAGHRGTLDTWSGLQNYLANPADYPAAQQSWAQVRATTAAPATTPQQVSTPVTALTQLAGTNTGTPTPATTTPLTGLAAAGPTSGGGGPTTSVATTPAPIATPTQAATTPAPTNEGEMPTNQEMQRTQPGQANQYDYRINKPQDVDMQTIMAARQGLKGTR